MKLSLVDDHPGEIPKGRAGVDVATGFGLEDMLAVPDVFVPTERGRCVLVEDVDEPAKTALKAGVGLEDGEAPDVDVGEVGWLAVDGRTLERADVDEPRVSRTRAGYRSHRGRLRARRG